MPEQENNQTGGSVEKRVDAIENDVDEIVETVDVVVSDRLDALQKTLDSIMSKLSAPLSSPTSESQNSVDQTNDAKQLEIKPEQPKDVINNDEKAKPKKRTFRRNYR